MTHRLLRWLPWLLSAALLVGVIRLVPINEVAAALRQLRPAEIAALMVANGVVLLAITARWALLLRGQGYDVPFTALFGYRLAVFGLSYFTPGPHVGGEPLQLLLVEREQDVYKRQGQRRVAAGICARQRVDGANDAAEGVVPAYDQQRCSGSSWGCRENSRRQGGGRRLLSGHLDRWGGATDH